MSNYPDDIRNYDNDPRSPFYVPPSIECVECHGWFSSEDSHDCKYTTDPLCSHECVEAYEATYIEENACQDCGKLECECEYLDIKKPHDKNCKGCVLCEGDDFEPVEPKICVFCFVVFEPKLTTCPHCGEDESWIKH